MSITRLQQARQMYSTGQRVAKTLDGSRPGYRGDNAYGPSSRSNQATSIGQARSSNKSSNNNNNNNNNNTPQHSPHTRSGYTGPTNYGPQQPPQQFIGGKSYNVTPETRGERDRAILKQQILNQTTLGGNRIDKYGNTRKSPFKQNSGLGGLLMGGLGMLMGIPGLGLITGGFNRLKGGLDTLNTKLGDFRERTTGYRTQKEWEDARNQRRLQSRLDKLYSRKNLGKGYSQKNIDMLEAMGLSPTTPQNQDNARGSNLRNILNDDVNNLDLEQGNLNNLESLVAAADQGEFEVPGDNLPVLSASPPKTLASDKWKNMGSYVDDYPNLGMEEKTSPYSEIDISNIDKGRGSIIEDMYRSNAYPAETTGIQTVANNENFPLRSDFLVDIKNNQDITTLPAAREAINAMPVDPFDPFSDFKNSQQFQKENLNNPDYYKVINDYTGSKFRL